MRMLLDGIRTLDDIRVRGKRILVRSDLNEPVDSQGRIEDDRKIRASARTISELLSGGASVAVMAHQGRPGEKDFIPLQQHFEVLQQILGNSIEYSEQVIGEETLSKIRSLKPGRALLLGNVRRLDYEQKSDSAEAHSKRELVQQLSPYFDYFVNDAFAAIHRPHCSIVGFTAVLPSVIGRLMEDELLHLSPLIDNPARPSVYLFGGKKFSDFLPVLEGVVSRENVDTVMLSGLLAVAFLAADGRTDTATANSIMKEAGDGFFSKAASLMRGGKILLPSDFGFDVGGKRVDSAIEHWPDGGRPLDIGSKTIEHYSKILRGAGTVFISGPPGVYEIQEFSLGTRALFEAAAEGGAYVVAGGGHTSSAASRFEMDRKFSYISTGGGALEALISGKRLQVLEEMRKSAEKFASEFN
jgi:phosphoglycerate kinase